MRLTAFPLSYSTAFKTAARRSTRTHEYCRRPRELQSPLHPAVQTAPMASLSTHAKRHKVTVVGSGNWGSAIAKIVAENTAAHPELFEPDVQMWVFEEEASVPKESKHYDEKSELSTKPQKLSELINHFHENIKYLPDIPLPKNLHANPSITDSVKDSTILVFNLPHQFIEKTCSQLIGRVVPFARGISCVKGVAVSKENISLYSDVIGEKLGIYCGALSGANIATEVALEKYCETTVAYEPPKEDTRAPASMSNSPTASASDSSKGTRKIMPVPSEFPPLDHSALKTLFHRPYFHVRLTPDVTAVSLAGALKNIVALAAGFVVGLGWGDNAKAAIMRVGLMEMVRFGHAFFPDSGIKTETFTEESAGVADLITSCSSGRNFRCARMAVERNVTVQEVERTELNGQILQGVGTAEEVNAFLKARGREGEFPLFTAVYRIVEGKNKPQDLPDLIESSGQPKPVSRSSSPSSKL